MKKLEIRITDTRRIGRWARMLTSLAVLSMAPIGIGILVDSNAMQWTGFVMGILLMSGLAIQYGKTTTFHSTEDARDYLDKIDRGDV